MRRGSGRDGRRLMLKKESRPTRCTSAAASKTETHPAGNEKYLSRSTDLDYWQTCCDVMGARGAEVAQRPRDAA